MSGHGTQKGGVIGLDYAAENDSGPDNANHDWNGIFSMREGRREHRGTRLEGLDLMAVAPTILQQFGLPAPADMHGTVFDAGRKALSCIEEGAR